MNTHTPAEKFLFGIIGAGKVGLSIANKLFKINKLKWVYIHSANSESRFAKTNLPSNLKLYKLEKLSELPHAIFLTVPDNAIELSAQNLAQIFGEKLKNKYIFHTSGILPKDILKECRKYGAKIASLHPYQTFPRIDEQLLTNTTWGVHSTRKDYKTIAKIIKLLDGKAVFLENIDTHKKILYHSSAVLSSNYLNACLYLARKIAEECGINPQEFQQTIIQTTINNIFQYQELTLTGPIARGDAETLKKHLEELSKHKNLFNAYCHFALATLEVAFSNKIIPTKKYQALKQLIYQKLIGE